MNVNCTFVPASVPFMAIACVANIRMPAPCVTIPRAAHDKLHETCIFHATRKCGPRKHVTELFKVLSCCHAWTRV